MRGPRTEIASAALLAIGGLHVAWGFRRMDRRVYSRLRPTLAALALPRRYS